MSATHVDEEDKKPPLLFSASHLKNGFKEQDKGNETTSKQIIPKEKGAREGKESDYEVERIISKRTVQGKTKYLLKWKNYPDDQNSWEPEENLFCPEMIAAFEQENNECLKARNLVQKLFPSKKIPPRKTRKRSRAESKANEAEATQQDSEQEYANFECKIEFTDTCFEDEITADLPIQPLSKSTKVVSDYVPLPQETEEMDCEVKSDEGQEKSLDGANLHQNSIESFEMEKGSDIFDEAVKSDIIVKADILEEISQIPDNIVEATFINHNLHYLCQCYGKYLLIPSKVLKSKYPELVINFYQSRILWKYLEKECPATVTSDSNNTE